MTLAIIFDSVGLGEWFVLLAVVLIVVGPRRLPETARKIGQYYSKFRRAADSFKRQLLEMDTEFTQTVREATDEVRGAVDEMNAEFSGMSDPASAAIEQADSAEADGGGPRSGAAAADGREPVPPEPADSVGSRVPRDRAGGPAEAVS